MEKLKDLFKNSNYKKLLITILILLGIVSILGVSYANWFINEKQKDFNTLGSKCFELTMINEGDAISLTETYPISDEEGLSTTGYTFTIKNTCNTYATYEVNLEDLLLSENEKRLSGEYIKVSVNDGTPKNLITYEEKTPVIEGSDKAYELTSGSLGPEEEITYTVKLWMDESTPTLEETMNATFLSKVSIEAGYIPEENLENEIVLQANSQTEEINNQKETFEITGTSTNYNLIEYSLDNSHWTRIDEPSKNITIIYDFEEEKTYTFYVKDEVGNVKNIEIIPTKLDKTAPTIDIEEIDNQESINLNIILTDEKSNQLEYAITESKEEPTEWKEYTEGINYTVTENKNYYIWVKDEAGNVTYQIYSASTIDTQAPELMISNTLTDWGEKDTIIIQATDDVIGISGISISTSEDTYNWEVVENTLSYETTKEVTTNGTYYISVKDAYEHITTKSIVINKIDDINPTIESISSDIEWGITNQITGTLKDNETSLSGYQVTKENTEPTEWISVTGNSYSLNYEATENGTYYVWVKDTANNIYSTSIEVNKIDNTPPIVNFTATSTETSITVNASSSTDEGSGIKTYYYSKDNGSSWYSSTSSSYTFTNLTEGTTYQISVKVEDSAGNESIKADKNVSTLKQPTAAETILALGETEELAYDNTTDNNLRYIGANPNNYVSFNNELWRIIGVFNNIDGGTGTKETRLKIIRSESIGRYSWDNKGDGTGSSTSSYGSNDWSDSALQIVLNEGAYWNRTSGECPYGRNGATTSCDFSATGLTEEAKSMISNAKWNLGGSSTYDDVTASMLYERERGTIVYSGRPTEWIGKIGLMYPSEVGAPICSPLLQL